MLPDLTKFLSSSSRTLLKRGFQTLHYCNFAWGLPIHTRFDDLDPWSQVCRDRKVQIVFLQF